MLRAKSPQWPKNFCLSPPTKEPSMSKSVAFKQPANPPSPQLDAWVGARQAAPITPPAAALKEPMTHFTVDLPESLHTRFRMECVRRRVKAYELLPQILEKALDEMEAGV